MMRLNVAMKMIPTLFIVAVSAGAAITRTFWPAVIMRVPSSCGMDSLATGPKSTRYDTLFDQMDHLV